MLPRPAKPPPTPPAEALLLLLLPPPTLLDGSPLPPLPVPQLRPLRPWWLAPACHDAGGIRGGDDLLSCSNAAAGFGDVVSDGGEAVVGLSCRLAWAGEATLQPSHMSLEEDRSAACGGEKLDALLARESVCLRTFLLGAGISNDVPREPAAVGPPVEAGRRAVGGPNTEWVRRKGTSTATAVGGDIVDRAECTSVAATTCGGSGGRGGKLGDR